MTGTSMALPSQLTFVEDLPALEALHGPVPPHSFAKEITHITPAYRRMIAASPFLVLATNGPDGLDCSPRGDPAGFVEVVDERTLLLPERRGNNRLDSMRNLLIDPRVSLLFLIPGVDETLRVIGTARLCSDERLRERFTVAGKLPHVVLVIDVQSVYFQCARALVRSRLWKAEAIVERKTLPTVGDMLAEATHGERGGAEHDRAHEERLHKTLY